jgi:hypothetical protein
MTDSSGSAASNATPSEAISSASAMHTRQCQLTDHAVLLDIDAIHHVEIGTRRVHPWRDGVRPGILAGCVPDRPGSTLMVARQNAPGDLTSEPRQSE